jgi:hypothetical protein
MATIKVTDVTCFRQQDVTGDDEAYLYIAGYEVWNSKIDKGETETPNESRSFSGSVVVELKEANGNSKKSLGKWTVVDSPVSNKKLVATSSGYHYEVVCDIS